MSFKRLKLWTYQEKQIQACLVSALEELITRMTVRPEDDELDISGKLRPLVIKTRKKMSISCTLHPEASVFTGRFDPKPSGHPDFQFSFLDTEKNQWDYHVECKLVRVKRISKNWDYCKHYVADGVKRFQSRKYCADGFSGTMVGYVQEGDFSKLLSAVNQEAKGDGLPILRRLEKWQVKGMTRLIHILRACLKIHARANRLVIKRMEAM